MTKMKILTSPLVDPGLYTLAHSQEFLSPAFLTRDLPVLPKWRHHRMPHRKWYLRLFSYWRNKQNDEKASAMRMSNTLSPRFPY
jgi:hypothetical protein